MKPLIWIFTLFFLDLNYAVANQELGPHDSYELIQEESQEEENCEECEDLVVDRDHDRGRDERRNLYEYNRDTLRHEAEEKEWKTRNRNRALKNSFPDEHE